MGQPPARLWSVDHAFGGWAAAQARFFDAGKVRHEMRCDVRCDARCDTCGVCRTTAGPPIQSIYWPRSQLKPHTM